MVYGGPGRTKNMQITFTKQTLPRQKQSHTTENTHREEEVTRLHNSQRHVRNQLRIYPDILPLFDCTDVK